MTKWCRPFVATIFVILMFSLPVRADVLINEIMYHPMAAGVETPLVEFIELHNTDLITAIDLTGWRLTKGVDFEFPIVTIPPSGFLVVTADVAAFSAKYPSVANVVGGWSGQLANSGERIKLVDSAAELVDEVTYSDQGDWAARDLVFAAGIAGWTWISDADGGGHSLSLIDLNVDNSLGRNWGISAPFEGSPGVANPSAGTVVPIISDVMHSPAVPSSSEKVTVSARVDGALVEAMQVTLRWRLASGVSSYTLLPMSDENGDGVFTAEIGVLAEGVEVEFYVGIDSGGSVIRSWPAQTTNGTRLNAMYEVDSRPLPEGVAVYRLITTPAAAQGFDTRARSSDSLVNATLIISSGAGDTVRHLCGFRARGNSSRNSNPPPIRINLPRDNPLNGESKLNINSRFSWLQTLGMEMFAEAGMAAPHAKRVEFMINGVDQARETSNMHGSYVHMQPIGDAFIDQNFPSDRGGNLYKKRSATGDRDEKRWGVHFENTLVYNGANWYLTDNWSKLSNEDENDWSDLQTFVETMQEASGDSYLNQVSAVVDVDQWVRWFAIMTFMNSHETNLSNGIDDDYSMYRPANDSRFKLLPHDLDTIFGEGDTNSDPDDSIFPMLVAGIPRASEDGRIPQLIKFFQEPEIRAKYYAQVHSLLTHEFSKPNFDSLVDNTLGAWVTPEDIAAVLAYADERRDYLLGVVGAPLSVTSLWAIGPGGFPRTTSSQISLSGAFPGAEAASVVVNGLPADLLIPQDRWQKTAIDLLPGINRITVDALGEMGEVLASEFIEIFYDAGPPTQVGGTISSDTTIPAQGGPYEIANGLVVAAGATLTIEAGTNIFLAADQEITVNGVLRILGTKYAPVRVCPNPNSPFVPNLVGNGGLPDGPPKSRGIQFVDSMSDQNLLQYVDVRHAQSVDGSVGVHRSEVVLDHMTFAGTHLRMLYADSSSVILENSTFPDMFAEGESPDGLDLDNISEHVKAIGAYPAGGHFIIRDNVFGTNAGHNDVVDVDSGRRPDPILQVLGNTFLGAGDEALDLGGDAYVAGNFFMNIFKDDETSDRGYANAISTGDAGSGTTIVTVRNVFWDVDHAINLKIGTATIFENNTVVKIHDDFLDRFGNPNVGSAINLYVDEPGAQPGDGAYAGNNIFWQSPRIFGNADKPGSTQTPVELEHNLISQSIAAAEISTRLGTALTLDPNSIVGAPNFVDDLVGNFTVLSDSAAVGAGSAGQDLGAMVPNAIAITGEPPAITTSVNATLTVGGPGMFAYKYRVDGGAEIGPLPIGNGFDPANGTQRTALIELQNLAPGNHQVEVIGQDYAGNWQVSPTISKTWAIDLDHTLLVINEVSAADDVIELYNAGATAVDLAGMSLSDSDGTPGDYLISAGTMIAGGGYLTIAPDTFGLDMDGDSVVLFGSDGAMTDRVDFGIQLPNLSIGRIAGEWKLNLPTPDAANVRQPLGDARRLVINEWLATSEFRFNDDFVEIYNPDLLPVAIGEFYLSDDPKFEPEKFQIAALSYMAATGFHVFEANGDSGGNDLPFKLSSTDERLRLSDSDLLKVDEVHFQCETTDVSQGRLPDAGGSYSDFFLPTPGLSNSGETLELISETLIPVQAVWRYEESNLPQSTTWRSESFDDSSWGSGPGLLYSDVDDLTGPAGTPLLLNPPVTHYFRHEFTFSGNPADASFEFDIWADDGAVVYVNGGEVRRLRMTAGTFGHFTEAIFSTTNADREGPFSIPSDLIKAGSNLIAVEVHQSSNDSSDVVFGLEMRAARTADSGSAQGEVMREMLDSLRITEIMYAPAGSGSEFIEVKNIGNSTLNLAGLRFADGIDFTFPSMLLGPGQFVVVVGDSASFEAQYGNAINVAGQFTGKLSNGGERLILQLPAPYEAAIMKFSYSEVWHPQTDGVGHSLEIVDEVAEIDTWGLAESWRVSADVGGSPAQTPPTMIVSSLNSETTLADRFAYQILATNNPQSYTAVGLPLGLTLDSSSGLISGTTAEFGEFLVDLTAINAAGSDTQVLQLEVSPSGEFARYEWEPIAGLQPMGVAFPVSIRAVDTAGRTVISHNRFLDLTAFAGPKSAPSVVISECTDRTTDTIEFTNVSDKILDTRGWRVVANDSPDGITDITARLCPLPAMMFPGQVVYRTDDDGNNFFGANLRFQHTFEGGEGRRGWAMILDDQRDVVDFVIWGYSAVDLSTTQVTIEGRDYTLGDYWIGGTMFWASASGISLQRFGLEDSDSAGDWFWDSTSRGVASPALEFPLQGGPTPVALTPISVSMVDGVWQGMVTINEPAENLFLVGEDFNQVQTSSNRFNVRELTDTDTDGMPDLWETGNGLNALVDDADGDLDGDGQTNLEEYLASTDPQDPQSTLRVNSVEELDDGDVRINWSSVSGGRYRVMFSSDLQSWAELPSSRSIGQSTSSSYRHTAGRSAERRYYRVEASVYF